MVTGKGSPRNLGELFPNYSDSTKKLQSYVAKYKEVLETYFIKSENHAGLHD